MARAPKLPQIDAEQIPLLDTHQMVEPVFANASPRRIDPQRIDVVSNGPAAEAARCGNQDAAVAATQIVHRIGLAHVSQLQHGIDHIRRRRDVHDVWDALQGDRPIVPSDRFTTLG